MNDLSYQVPGLAGRTVKEAFISADGTSLVLRFDDGSLLDIWGNETARRNGEIDGVCICTTNG